MTSPEAGSGTDPEGAPGDGTAAQPQSPAQPPARPQPQYGELAPEGWSWSPDGETGTGGEPGTGTGRDAQPPASPPAAGSSGTGAPPSAGRLPGVPHNLGVTGARQAPTPPGAGEERRGSTAGDPEPYRAAPPQQPYGQQFQAQQQPQPQQAPSGAPGQQARPAPRAGDRVVTIALLVLGAFGALYFAASLQQMPGSLSLLGAAFGLEGLVVPGAIQTLGTVGALVVLALYAVNVIYSIQRMRAGRLAFWVPLVTAAVAFIVAIVCVSIGLNQVPELMAHLSDPDATAKLFEYLGEQTG